MRKRFLISIALLAILLLAGILMISPIKNKSAAKNLSLGIVFFDSGKYENAALLFEKAIKHKNNYTEAYIFLAKSQLKLELFDDALENI